MSRKPMFKKLMDEKLGGSTTSTTSPNASSSTPSTASSARVPTTSVSSVPGSADDRESLKGESDTESVKEMKPNSAARDVAFLQARLQDLMGKLKALKKEKEAVEVNANNARAQHVEREEELMREHQKKQNEMQESFHLSLKQKETEKLELQKRIEESEKLREKYSQRNEESDELKDFQNQELGKVKHMLILAQNQVTRLEAESAATSSSLAKESSRVEEVERKLRDTEETLQLKTAQLRSLEEKSAEDTAVFTSTLKDFRTEKAALQNENKRLTEFLNQKVAAYSVLEEKLACLEEDYARDARAAEIYKRESEAAKIASADEKSQLIEKIQGLESRLGSADLGEDEKFQALEKERQTLERRLVESREQLTEIKTSWSSKIEALESQISHLNLKQVDDNADLAAKEDEMVQLKTNYSAQIEDYQVRLRDADARHAELASTSEEQRLKLERRFAQKESEAEHFRSEAERWKTDAETAKAEAENVRQEAEISRTRLSSVASDLEESRKRMETLTTSLAAAESSLLEAELTAEEKTKELRLAQEEKEEGEKRLTRELETLKAEAETLKAEVEKASKTGEGEMERWKAETTKLREDKDRLSSEVACWKEEVEKIKNEKINELDSLTKRLEESRTEMDVARRQWNEERRALEEESREKSARIEELSLTTPKIDSTTSPAKTPASVSGGEEVEEEESKRAKETAQRSQRLIADLAAERKEKDALLLRNAELSQNVTTLKSQLASATAAVVATAASPPTPPEESSSGESDKAQLGETSLQVLDVESSTKGGGGGGESGNSSDFVEMTKTIADLQNQLAERNKTVKLQQQRIGDLRKTIQRELKLQSGGGGGGANGLSTQGHGMNYGSSSEDLPGLCADATSSSSPNTLSHHHQQQQPHHIPHNGSSSSLSSKVMPPSSSSSVLDSEVGAAYPLGAHHNHVDSAVPCSITSNGVKASSSAAVLPNVSPTCIIPPSWNSSSSPFLLNAGSSDVDDVIFPAASSATGEPSVVSFRYLKHVIIRFMISNEYEAQHLVKAVSTLLRFDKEEEKLVTDHLNYKVSWFGSKPSLKKLKSAKVRDVL